MNEKKKISVDDIDSMFFLSIYFKDYDIHKSLCVTDTIEEAYENACKDFIDRIGKDLVAENYKQFYSLFSREDYRQAYIMMTLSYNTAFRYQIEDFSKYKGSE